MARLLLIEDDCDLAEAVVREIARMGHSVTHAAEGREGLAAACLEEFQVIIMDRMLPGLDGLSILEALRERHIRIPVLLMSALGDVDERVRGLKAGGDDYVAKPFALIELIARIEALLRRPVNSRATCLRIGSLEIDLIDRTVQRGGRTIDLLPREFKLLDYFMRRPGQVLTRAMLLEDVWNYRFLAESNLVDVHVGKLRRKIDLSGETPMFQSVRGSGFMLVSDQEDGSGLDNREP